MFTPLVERFFREMHQQILSIWFLVVLLKFYWLNFSSSCPGELPRDLFSAGGKRKYAIFQVFRAYPRDTSIVSHEIFMVARSHRVLAADIKSLLISALLSLESFFFSEFWFLIYRLDQLHQNKCFDFVPPYGYQDLVKISLSYLIENLVFEISGWCFPSGVFPPPRCH